MKLTFSAFILIIIISIVSCGIDEFKHIPQIPPGDVRLELNTNAEITINPQDFVDATGFTIFYKIYFSSEISVFTDTRTLITALNNDYNALDSFTDPAATTTLISSNTFSNRGFYEINNTIGSNTQQIAITFPEVPALIPFIEIDGNLENLERSSKLNLPNFPQGQRYFRNTDELNITGNESINNADVAAGGNSANATNHAFTLMYISAYGTENFRRVFGKPTLIGVLKLTNIR